MELPNYSMATFRQQRRSRAGHDQDATSSARATYEEVRLYYIQYVRRHRLANNFRNGCQVTAIERVCLDQPFYDDRTEEICAPQSVWEIRGYDEATRNPFVLHAKYVVLATGISQEITRPLGIVGEQVSQSFTFTNVHDVEDLIVNKQCLTSRSKPLLVVGCGLTAVDAILLCQQYSIPVLHVFRRAIDDHELVLNQLSASIYPECEHIRELMRQPPSPVRSRKGEVDSNALLALLVLSMFCSKWNCVDHRRGYRPSTSLAYADYHYAWDFLRGKINWCWAYDSFSSNTNDEKGLRSSDPSIYLRMSWCRECLCHWCFGGR